MGWVPCGFDQVVSRSNSDSKAGTGHGGYL